MSHSVSPRLTVCVLASLRAPCAAMGAATAAERRAVAVSDRPRREVITRSRGAAPDEQARRNILWLPPAAAGGCSEDDRRPVAKRAEADDVTWRTCCSVAGHRPLSDAKRTGAGAPSRPPRATMPSRSATGRATDAYALDSSALRLHVVDAQGYDVRRLRRSPWL